MSTSPKSPDPVDRFSGGEDDLVFHGKEKPKAKDAAERVRDKFVKR